MINKSYKLCHPNDVQAIKELVAKTDPHVGVFLGAGKVVKITNTKITLCFDEDRAVAQSRCEKHKSIIYKAGLDLGFDVVWEFISSKKEDGDAK